MLLTIASAFFFTEIKSGAFRKLFSRLIQQLWVKWELQGMVMLSLLFQFALLWFPLLETPRQIFSLCRYLAWLSYVAADWVATVALSALLKAKVKELTSELVVFWMPFLLLHLGGPHNINAYALTDNEIWLRCFHGLLIQVGVAIYACVKVGTNNTLRNRAIPIFITGIIKYGERIWILKAASHKQFSHSVFSSISHNTAKSLDNFLTSGSTGSNCPQTLNEYLRHNKVIEEGIYFHKAYYLYNIYIPFFSELRLRIYRNLRDNFMLSHMISAEDAFKSVQIELGFLYDMLYTKTTVLQSMTSIILQSICFLCTFAAVIGFSITVGNHGYPWEDICITYLLLGGAIFVDMYSAISHTLSDWTMFCLSNASNLVHKFVGCPIVTKVVHFKAKKKGMVSVAQHRLIDYCLKVKTSGWISNLRKILRLIDNEDILGKFWCTSWEQVNPNLKDFIHSHLHQQFKPYQNNKDEMLGEKIDEKHKEFNHELLSSILKERGEHVLEGKGNVVKHEFEWSINDVEFSQSILLWHIATFLLFYDDNRRYSNSARDSYSQISKLLSDYMMHILMVRLLMLPKGIGLVRIRDTREEVIRFFGNMKPLKNNDAASALLHIDNNVALFPKHSKSVLRDGCKLACKLEALVEEMRWDLEEKWEIIAKCGWKCWHMLQANAEGNIMQRSLGMVGSCLPS